MTLRNEMAMEGYVDFQREWIERQRTAFVALLVLAALNGYRGAPGVPVDTGELAQSFHVNGRQAIGSSADALLAGVPLGRSIIYTWEADHASIIEGGRRPDKNGRMIGSLQAPHGWWWIALDIAVAEFS